MKSHLQLSALFALAVAQVSAATPAGKPPLQHAMMGVANGCFVETVAFLDQWNETQGANAWARLLQWGAREDEEVVMGHAVGICEARGALWCWDSNFGWAKLPVEAAKRDDVTTVAAPVLKRYPRVSARFPTYRSDFPQVARAEKPAAQLTATNTSVRDASIVGAQLAKKRPVNVVRFSHGPEEAKQESAAAVFVFHGRYCVYVPEMGTVPFRVRGDVANLRLIQELLRRAFPGVSGVKKI
ncbi:MAG: hypothetical protein ACREH8_07225 [Opitutaceae bacterium]